MPSDARKLSRTFICNVLSKIIAASDRIFIYATNFLLNNITFFSSPSEKCHFKSLFIRV